MAKLTIELDDGRKVQMKIADLHLEVIQLAKDHLAQVTTFPCFQGPLVLAVGPVMISAFGNMIEEAAVGFGEEGTWRDRPPLL